MTAVEVKVHKSRAKKGWSKFAVDARAVGGKQRYFATKQKAQSYAQLFNEENTGSDAWDWTMGKLFVEWSKAEQLRVDVGNLTAGTHINKQRDMSAMLEMTVAGKKLKDVVVSELTAAHLEMDLLPQVMEGRTLKTCKNFWAALKPMLTHAIKCGCRTTNPAKVVRPIHGGVTEKKKEKARRISPQLIDKIIGAMRGKWKLMAQFARTTGLRQGEQRCLTWGDFTGLLEPSNLGCKVHVTKAVKARTYDIGEPKTEAGIRDVNVPAFVADELRERYMALGRPELHTYVWPSTTGLVLAGQRFVEAISQACSDAGVQHVTWHELRHHYASMLLKKFGQEDLWTVANLMGHENTLITQDTYGHWLADEEEEIALANTIDDIFA